MTWEMKQTSVSQIESADETQGGGCLRRWYFDVPQGIRPKQNAQQSDGDVLHGHLAKYLRGEGPPEGRVRMGKVARATILKGELPAPGPDLFVEERFDRQPKFSGETWPDGSPKWVPLDVTKTIVIAGVPLDGFIDLSFRRGEVPEVWDHKTSSSAENLDAYAKPGHQLPLTDQMPVYVFGERRRWPDANRWRVVHHNVSRVGAYSFVRDAIVTWAQILERIAHVEGVIGRMKVYGPAPKQDDVPFNRRACRHWLGCAHQSVCRAFKENLVALRPEEEDLFKSVDGGAAPAQPAAAGGDDPFAAVDALGKPTAPAQPAPAAPAEDDEEAAALRALEAARAAKAAKAAAAKKAADEAAAKAAEVEAEAKKRKLLMVDVCRSCGVELNAENGSKLRSGAWVHIGCPKAPAVVPPDAPPSDPAKASEQPAPEGAKKPGRPPKPKPEAAPAAAPAPAPSGDAVTISLTISAADLAKLRTLLGK